MMIPGRPEVLVALALLAALGFVFAVHVLVVLADVQKQLRGLRRALLPRAAGTPRPISRKETTPS